MNQTTSSLNDKYIIILTTGAMIVAENDDQMLASIICHHHEIGSVKRVPYASATMIDDIFSPFISKGENK